MMLISHLLLSIFAEECSEVAKEASKVHRFGLYCKHTVTKVPNDIALKTEVCDVYGMIKLLQSLEFFGMHGIDIEKESEPLVEELCAGLNLEDYTTTLRVLMTRMISEAGKAMYAAMSLQEDSTNAENIAFFHASVIRLYSVMRLIRELKIVFLPFNEMVEAGKMRMQRTIDSVDLSQKLKMVRA
jgi:hypothetical protein